MVAPHAIRRILAAARAALLALLTTGPMWVQAAVPSKELGELSLEQLSNIVVTSVSRHEEKLADAPAAIFVITAEDIRSSGARSLPEALRLAPNLQVARADTNQYAISARGFNNVLANKMLVLIDGRTIYTPLFSGVFWEAQDTLLEDIDRIEVISGPGTTLWGANAVNGVINVITRNSKDTVGTLVSAGGGNREYGGGARYGAVLPNGGTYRAYGTYFDRYHSQQANGTPIRDGSKHGQAGFRADWVNGEDAYTFQGDAYQADIDQAPEARTISGLDVLGRWTRQFADGGNVVLQAYFDRTERNHPGQFGENLNTFDVEFQHLLAPISNHVVLWGAGARYAQDMVTNSPLLAFLPASRDLNWAHVFGQDEIALASSVALIIGAKLESNVYTGTNFLPNVRLAWHPVDDGLLWAAISRAARAPSRIDRDYFQPGKPPYLIAGGPDFQSEIATVYELGYRAQPTPDLSFTINGYHYDYDRLRSLLPTPGGLVWSNDIAGTTTGLEAWGAYRISAAWRVYGGVTTLRKNLHVKAGAVDVGGLAALGNDPSTTWMLRSTLDIAPAWELDAMVRRVAALPSPAVPAYTAVDVRLGWQATPTIALSLTGGNVFDPGHTEWGVAGSRAEFQRSYFLNVVWKI
ncbi:MAG: TonB-dependent receptor [Casimicrobiaceae bacterium]